MKTEEEIRAEAKAIIAQLDEINADLNTRGTEAARILSQRLEALAWVLGAAKAPAQLALSGAQKYLLISLW